MYSTEERASLINHENKTKMQITLLQRHNFWTDSSGLTNRPPLEIYFQIEWTGNFNRL